MAPTHVKTLEVFPAREPPTGQGKCGLRWQSAAATPLWNPSACLASKSGVALRFPPQSKTESGGSWLQLSPEGSCWFENEVRLPSLEGLGVLRRHRAHAEEPIREIGAEREPLGFRKATRQIREEVQRRGDVRSNQDFVGSVGHTRPAQPRERLVPWRQVNEQLYVHCVRVGAH